MGLQLARRKELCVLASVVVTAAAPALADKIVVSNWDGYMPKDMAEQFKKATGHDLEVDGPCHQ